MLRGTRAMAVHVERQRARVDGVTIGYEVMGAGEPLVLIHGLSGSGRWWHYNLEALAAHFHVFVIDLIGFGASRGQRFELERASSYLAEWLRQRAIAPARIVGHSMGGYIAADLAADYPDLVEQLVLVDPALLLKGGLLPRAVGLVRAIPTLPLNFMPVLVYDALRAGPLTLASAITQLLGGDLGPKLARIEAPTLIIWGEYDTLVPPELAKPLAQALPSIERAEVIRGAGHNPMWDRPKEFNRIVLEFLRGTA